MMRELLAPSYKAICLAIMRNDQAMTSLGFTARPSLWYMDIKRAELAARGVVDPQMRLW